MILRFILVGDTQIFLVPLQQFEIVKFTYTEGPIERLLKDIQDTLRVLDILLNNDVIFNASIEG